MKPIGVRSPVRPQNSKNLGSLLQFSSESTTYTITPSKKKKMSEDPTYDKLRACHLYRFTLRLQTCYISLCKPSSEMKASKFDACRSVHGAMIATNGTRCASDKANGIDGTLYGARLGTNTIYVHAASIQQF